MNNSLLRLPCGCLNKCDPCAHDTAWDWDGTPDGPPYTRCLECDEKIYEGEPHACQIDHDEEELASEVDEFSAEYQDRERNQ